MCVCRMALCAGKDAPEILVRRRLRELQIQDHDGVVFFLEVPQPNPSVVYYARTRSALGRSHHTYASASSAAVRRLLVLRFSREDARARFEHLPRAGVTSSRTPRLCDPERDRPVPGRPDPAGGTCSAEDDRDRCKGSAGGRALPPPFAFTAAHDACDLAFSPSQVSTVGETYAALLLQKFVKRKRARRKAMEERQERKRLRDGKRRLSPENSAESPSGSGRIEGERQQGASPEAGFGDNRHADGGAPRSLDGPPKPPQLTQVHNIPAPFPLTQSDLALDSHRDAEVGDTNREVDEELVNRRFG